MTTPDDIDEVVRGLRDELVRAETAARVARRRVDELELAVAGSADAVAERDLIRDRIVDVDGATARAEAATARAEAAERRLAAIQASRVWRAVQLYDRATRRLRRP